MLTSTVNVCIRARTSDQFTIDNILRKEAILHRLLEPTI